MDVLGRITGVVNELGSFTSSTTAQKRAAADGTVLVNDDGSGEKQGTDSLVYSSSVCTLALWVAALASGNLDQPNSPTFWVACFVLWFVIAFVLQAAFLRGGGAWGRRVKPSNAEYRSNH